MHMKTFSVIAYCFLLLLASTHGFKRTIRGNFEALKMTKTGATKSEARHVEVLHSAESKLRHGERQYRNIAFSSGDVLDILDLFGVRAVNHIM